MHYSTHYHNKINNQKPIERMSSSILHKCIKDFEGAPLKAPLQLGDFTYQRKLGRGAYGEVFQVIYKKSQTSYAIKAVSKKLIENLKMVNQLKNEVEIMDQLKHENIVEFLYYFEDQKNIYFVLELAEAGHLYARLKKVSKYSEKQAAKYFYDVLKAVNYLHQQQPPIIHRDIKPENILFINDNLKLADFGWSNLKDRVRTTFCGTPDYLAPEMITESGHSEKLDIWTLGILLYELVIGRAPFTPAQSVKDQKNQQKQLEKNIMTAKIVFPSHVSMHAQQLIMKMLERNPERRPSCRLLLRDQWFVINQVKLAPDNEIDFLSDSSSLNVSQEAMLKKSGNVPQTAQEMSNQQAQFMFDSFKPGDIRFDQKAEPQIVKASQIPDQLQNSAQTQFGKSQQKSALQTSEIAQSTKKNNNTNLQISNSESQITNYYLTKSKMSNDEKAQLFRDMVSKIESQKRQIGEFQTALQIKNSVIDSLQKDSEQRSKALQSQLKQQKSLTSSKGPEESNGDNDDKIQNLQAQKSRLEQQVEIFQKHSEENEDLKTKVIRLEAETRNLSSENKKLKQKLDNKTEEMDQEVKRNQEFQEKIQGLEQQIQDLSLQKRESIENLKVYMSSQSMGPQDTNLSNVSQSNSQNLRDSQLQNSLNNSLADKTQKQQIEDFLEQLSLKIEHIKQSQDKFQIQETELDTLKEENSELRIRVKELESSKETELMIMQDQMQNSIQEQIIERQDQLKTEYEFQLKQKDYETQEYKAMTEKLSVNKMELERLQIEEEEKGKKLDLLKEKNTDQDLIIQGLERNFKDKEEEVTRMITVIKEYQEQISKIKAVQYDKRKQ